MKIYADGSRTKVCYLIEEPPVMAIVDLPAQVTVNEGEYQAIICALEQALVLKARQVAMYSDSEVVVRQINGQYQIHAPHLKLLHKNVKSLAEQLDEFSCEWLPRLKNKAGLVLDKLPKKANNNNNKANNNNNNNKGEEDEET